MPGITNSSVISNSTQIANGVIVDNNVSASAAIQQTKLSGAAKSGANSDITSLTGLTTPLTVAQGGIGVGTLGANGVVIGQGTGALQATGAGTSGQVLKSNGAGVNPSFGAVPAQVTAVLTTPLSINTTTAETNIFTSTVPAGLLGTGAGVFGQIFFGNNQGSGTTGTTTYRLYYGATVIASVVSTSDTNRPNDGMIHFCILAAGATNSQRGAMNIQTGDERMVATGTAAVDSTAAQTIKVTAQHSVSGAAMDITLNAAFFSA